MNNIHYWKRAGLGATGLALIATAFVAGRAGADGIPSTGALTYSGTLEDTAGALLTGDHEIEVRLWPAASGGTTPLCTTTPQSVTVVSGRFFLTLPDDCTTDVKANADVWTEVLVDGASLGRARVGAVPYAVEADRAQTAVSATNASTATGALDTRITNVENRVVLTTIVFASAVPGDAWHSECLNQTGAFSAGACSRMASDKCVALGYTSGFLQGHLVGSSIGVTCVE
jgi:hypothetical protein